MINQNKNNMSEFRTFISSVKPKGNGISNNS